MYLSRLEVQSFRNLAPAAFEFNRHKNFIFGDNAQGKTNIIEAIYLLCLAKSFRTREDADLTPFEKEGYLVEGSFISEEQFSHHVGIMYDANYGKVIKVDGKKLNQFSKLVGLFPIIVLSVDDYQITSGPPAQRRRFFNVLLSQCSKRYLDDLKQYDKVLKQRNTVLAELNTNQNKLESLLAVWSEQLSELGARVMAARAKMVDELNSYMTNFYAAITNQKWTFRVVYNPNIAFQDTDQIKEKFDQALKRTRFKEKQRAKTIVGPHRDEFTFFISDNDLRKFGSRGEHKSALVSLKAAESQVLYKRTEIYPILLLDDLFAELDRQRSTKVLDLFDPSSQLFITGTTLDYVGMRESSDILNNQATFMVKNGAINRV